MKTIGSLLCLTLAVAQLGCCITGCPPTPPPLGRFQGDPKTEWLSDGRTMKLLADFAYFDPGGAEWDAATGSQIDGASIPRLFWSLIGGPFEGEYRNASIVHDVACQRKDRDWRLVHRMFYDACRCGGVGEFQAKLMYSGVYHFGPRWGDSQEQETVLSSEDDLERLQLVVANDPNVETNAIERLTAATLRQRVPDLPAPADTERIIPPRFREALDAGGRRDVRLGGEGRRLEFLVRNENEGLALQKQIPQLRAAAARPMDGQVRDLQARIGAETDRTRRAALASQLVTLTRERRALDRAEVRIRVAP